MKSKPIDGGRGKSGSGGVPLLVVAILLVLPVMALKQRGVNLPFAAGYAAVINVLTYWTYSRDKRRAIDGEWRISEATLHLLELLGGWPGAWIAQRRLRHKCSKISYQFVFWLIVFAYQFVAFDSFQNWQISRTALSYADQALPHRR